MGIHTLSLLGLKSVIRSIMLESGHFAKLCFAWGPFTSRKTPKAVVGPPQGEGRDEVNSPR